MKPYETISDEEGIIGKAVVNAAYKVHKELDPRLLEKIYETFITKNLGFWQCYWF
ncbi:MAG: hypothetical protein RBR28_11140 [Lentimicrobium sp.]|jgi:hypothetical protein|nr:hypothetical protein [Lentimicrobium sp.]